MRLITPLTFAIVLLALSAGLGATPPLSLPVGETWDNPAANQWTAGITHWSVDGAQGDPAPSARFVGLPSVSGYSIPLISHEVDASTATGVRFCYELRLDNGSAASVEELSVQIGVGGSWWEIDNIDNQTPGGADIPWTQMTWNISSLAAGNVFQVRFVAQGDHSGSIDAWYLDNISLEAFPILPAPQNVGASREEVYGEYHPVITWDLIPGDWPGEVSYIIFHTTDPLNGPWEDCGCVFYYPPGMDNFYPEVDKRFYRVIARLDWDEGVVPAPVLLRGEAQAGVEIDIPLMR